MTDLSPEKLALLKIRELKQQVHELQQQQSPVSEPIAIVSMACRFPRHSSTPEAFWQSLIDQNDEVTEIPEDRWDLEAFYDENPDVPGTMYARHGVFLDNLDMMDPEFFGISPREATWIDPQQRLLMEVGWEAIERAGWLPEKIGASTGIFVGWMHNDYQNEASDSFLNLNPYIATGAAGSFLCGRLSYYLGLQGPSVAVDTACSSSLVALHLGCQSLQQRECDHALVGGVNVICSPTTNILTCKLKALSPNGHSRAFDAAADGYLRGEGCGVVTLRRLSDAERDGDTILGVIRGSAIGHNGFSSGLTAPNPKAQEKVIRQALERAQLSPERISYLEAHGTGTELGDPIEMRAAAAALAMDRNSDSPLYVGSVKTNIGHLEAAAGMAGLIKVLLSLQNDGIPGQLNFETPNPHIDWDKMPVKVLTEPTDWPQDDQRIAGVSAFGMSGTNAHVIVEQHNTKLVNSSPAPYTETASAQLITLSGKNEEAVQELAASFQRQLEQDSLLPLADVAFTVNTCRTRFEQRAALIVKDREHAIESFKTLSRGGQSVSLFEANSRRPPKIAWQYTGQGSQYVGMAQGLYQTEPVFRAAINECETQLRDERNESLTDVLFHHPEKINHTSWTQPSIFAVQMGLTKLLKSYELYPDVVFGHSVGQYAAACAAGSMSWEDGLRLISERGRLIGDLPSEGLMLAVFAPLNEVQNELESANLLEEVSIAALNGTHVVVSGDDSAVTSLHEQFNSRNIRCKALTTSHAFHSKLMNPVLEPFEKFANRFNYEQPLIPLVCNVTGQVLDSDSKLDGNYWAKHIREAVRFSEGVQTVQDLGCEMILEVGPQPVLTRMAAANWKKPAEKLFSALQKDTDDSESLLKTLGWMFVNGATPNLSVLYEGKNRKRVSLPTYPFQRRRFWGPDKPRAAHAAFHTAHPLLGNKVSLAGVAKEIRYENFIEPDSPSWLPDHEVMDHVVVPGAAFVEIAFAGVEGASIDEIVFEQPLRPSARTAVQTVVRTNDDGQQSIEIYSSEVGSSEWTRHFTAKSTGEAPETPDIIDREELQQSCDQNTEPSRFYEKLKEIGLNYGPQFRTIQSLNYSREAVLCRLAINGDIRGFTIPPTILDGALHSLAVGLLHDDDGTLFLPVGMESFQCFHPVEQDVWCYANWRKNEGELRSADLTLFDDSGRIVAKIAGLKVKQIEQAVLRRMSGVGASRLLYELDWQNTRLPAGKTSEKSWLIISSTGSSASQPIASQLQSANHSVVEVQLEACEEVRMISEKSETNGQEAEQHVSATKIALNGSLPEHWDNAFEKLSTDDTAFAPDGIVWLFDGGDRSNGISETKVNCEGLLHLQKTLQSREIRRIECGLQLVTNSAIAIDSDSQCDATQTQYWGLGRVIAAESPEYRSRLIDVDLVNDQESWSSPLLDILLTETTDSQFAIRDSHFFVPRMKHVSKRTSNDSGFQINSEGSYLITGGLGMLGRQAAKWLSDKGATQVVLVSRRLPDEATREFLDEIEATGCEVVVHSADLGNRQDVQKMFERFDSDLNPLAGIIHAAGVLDDALIADQTWERFEKVLAPKISGAELLDEFSKSLPLDFFVLYSSVASVLGSPGQSNYATGNAFLDGLAWQRHAQGLPATSINWGPWTEGMADDERIAKRLALQGITPLTVDEAHQMLEQILTSGVVQSTVIDVDWRRMQMGRGGEPHPLLEGLVPAKDKTQVATSAFVNQLKRLRGNAQSELLVKTIQEILQSILATSDAPDLDRPLIEMGLDSLMAVEFSTQLQMMLGDHFTVGPTMLFDHPTINAIAAHVLEMVESETDDEKPAVEVLPPKTETPQTVERESIAIVGMSCRFPGANDVDEFWENLLNKVDSVREVPGDRWDIDRFYDENHEPGKMYTREGGFIEDIGDFDPAFFNISEQEACWIDPQHRMLLEVSYRALENAGISPHPLADSNVGVFMGIMGQDYAFLPKLDDQDIIKAFQGAGLSHSAGVGRISYIFGFEGPSIAVDTASSSSLVALHQAAKSLRDGECNMALAGGVNAILAPVNSLLMSKAGLLSPDGRCKSFSANANGFGRGEGCGVVVLKRLSDAQRDGDRIMAVIRGGAVVHNGFSGGITSPSGKAQSRVISEALQDAKVAPSSVRYLEAHGTGTEFGDPMELAAASSVYSKGRKRDEPLLVGSVKANISHLEAAGGISGVIKTVLSLNHGVIPPQVHFEDPSPHIPWQRMPVKMVTEATAWPEVEERLAGVTALGLVGTNAHVILSGPPQHASPQDDDSSVAGRPAQLLVLSGQNAEALPELTSQFHQFLESHPHIDLRDVCHTAALGRRHYPYRFALTFDSRDDALEKLADLKVAEISPVLSQPKIAWIFTGNSESQLDAAKQLYATEPEFRQVIKQFDQRLQEHQAKPKLIDWLTSENVGQNGSSVEMTDLHLFALQAGLAHVWKSWGIEPDAVLGFGIGQFAATCVAGGLSFEDALTLIAQREATLTRIQENPEAKIAALDQFEAYADTLNYYPPNLQLVCSITGKIVPVHRSLGGRYWREQLEATDSADSLDTLLATNCDLLLEIGPSQKLHILGEGNPRLSSDNAPADNEDKENAISRMLAILGRLYVEGVNPDFKSFNKYWNRNRVILPHHPFHKKRYWITEVGKYLASEKEEASELPATIQN